MAKLEHWEVSGMTFGGRSVRVRSGDLYDEPRVQVDAYRSAMVVPVGKKRAIKRTQPVLQGVVMSVDAWKELADVLTAAGATVTEKPRPW